MSEVPGAASLDKDWDSGKLHCDREALMEVTPVTEPIRRPRASPLAINAAAIGAILLRDIKRRAGTYYTGFLMILLMPLVHLLIVVAAFHIFGRLAPQGTDQVVYFGLSILPFVIYVYLSRQIVISLAENRPLLYFNRVKIFDILLARGILEAVGSVVFFYLNLHIGGLFNRFFAARLAWDRVRGRRDNLF
jgi:capsular polysaccharide transport system permease protein